MAFTGTRSTRRYTNGAKCVDCDQDFLPKWDGATTCTNCYYLLKEYSRPCTKCEVGFIRPEAPDEDLLCKKCLTNHYKDNMRKCSKCKKPVIYPTAPKHVIECNTCKNGGKVYSAPCKTEGCSGTVDASFKTVCGKCYGSGKR